MELGHHPFHKGKTYEDELGNRALKKQGSKKWNKLLQEAIADLRRTFNFDALYIGGGNSRLVDFKLPAGVKIVSNEQGLLGGIALWREPARRGAKAAPAAAKPRAVKTPPKPDARIAPRLAVSVSAKSAKPASPVASQPARAAADKTVPADSTPAASSAPARPANGA